MFRKVLIAAAVLAAAGFSAPDAEAAFRGGFRSGGFARSAAFARRGVGFNRGFVGGVSARSRFGGYGYGGFNRFGYGGYQVGPRYGYGYGGYGYGGFGRRGFGRY
ncbi:MAG: hypothetical protein AAF532_11955 [Planctomycetota bacterium]